METESFGWFGVTNFDFTFAFDIELGSDTAASRELFLQRIATRKRSWGVPAISDFSRPRYFRRDASRNSINGPHPRGVRLSIQARRLRNLRHSGHDRRYSG